jgi:hypothetical protein
MGHFAFAQTFPAKYPARPILHDHFRLYNYTTSVELTHVTLMYFFANESAGDSLLLQTVTIVRDPSTGARSVEFFISLDVGDTDYEPFVVAKSTTANPTWLPPPTRY